MRARTTVAAVSLMASVLGACGGGGGDSATSTLAPMESSVFKTIPTTSTTLTPDSATAAAEGGALGGEIIYEIQAGDYWAGIAQKYGCPDYRELITYNDNKENIFPGDQIKIPSACGQTTEVATETDTATGTTTTAAAVPETLAADGSAAYTIEAGDTLSGIASKFDTTMGAIVQINGWSDGIEHVLIPGRDIKVPVAG